MPEFKVKWLWEYFSVEVFRWTCWQKTWGYNASYQHLGYSQKLWRNTPPPNLEFIYTLYWQQNIKRILNRIHIIFPLVLLFKKNSPQSWRKGSAVIDYIAFQKTKFNSQCPSGISWPHSTISLGNSILLAFTVTWIHMHRPIHRHTYTWLKIKTKISL